MSSEDISPILKIFVLPVSFIFIAVGILTAAGIILVILVFGLKNSPIQLSHRYISIIETLGALGFIGIGLVGLFYGGSFLYNVGTDFYSIIPKFIVNIFHYPDVTNAGAVPYFNILVGLKVFVGLTAVVIAFLGFKSLKEEEEEDD